MLANEVPFYLAPFYYFYVVYGHVLSIDAIGQQPAEHDVETLHLTMADSEKIWQLNLVIPTGY